MTIAAIARILDVHRIHPLGEPTTIYLKSGRTLTGNVYNIDEHIVTIEDKKWYRSTITYYIVITEIEAIIG